MTSGVFEAYDIPPDAGRQSNKVARREGRPRASHMDQDDRKASGSLKDLKKKSRRRREPRTASHIRKVSSPAWIGPGAALARRPGEARSSSSIMGARGSRGRPRHSQVKFQPCPPPRSTTCLTSSWPAKGPTLRSRARRRAAPCSRRRVHPFASRSSSGG